MPPSISAGPGGPDPTLRSGPWRVAVLSGVGLLVACGGPEPDLDPRGAVEVATEVSACTPTVPAEGLRVDTLASGLTVPWDVAFLPGGRALVTERPGRIREVDPAGRLVDEPWAELDVYSVDEVGLMGIDAAPDGRSVYVSATVRSASGGLAGFFGRVGRRVQRALDPEKGHPTTLQVVRIPVLADGRAGQAEVVVEGLPSFLLHGGGALRFGPDGALYVTNGDGAEHVTAQRPDSRRGKILRYDEDGRAAAGNPTPGSPVWALGIRHVQGLAWDPVTGAMVAIDHGPTSMPTENGRRDRDELNVVEAGANFGWPIVTGVTEGGPWTSASMQWTPAIAPAGLALMDGVGPWSGSAFVTGLRGTSLRRIEFDRTSGQPVPACEETLLSTAYGRLRLVRPAPDGTLWVGTSNQDGRGIPRDGGDLLLRMHPPTS
ncbi:MAG: PQQ-dependent sugar dehydrogenase [Longimicrobiales bacterium]